MLKARRPGGAAKRLAGIEASLRIKVTAASWPRIMAAAEWEALAIPSQRKLCEDTRSVRVDAIEALGPDPHDVTHRYKIPKHAEFG